MIKLQNIHKSFADNVVLSDIDIIINPSEIVCLIGPSGCGKTTLLKIMSMVEFPQKGNIQIEDRQFIFPTKNKINVEGIYPNLTIVFQQFQLWNHLTVEENILLPVKKHISDRKQLFEKLVDILNIRQVLKNFPYQISVGQKQRVAFIRAVLTKPKYLLLDEVTSSLDIEHINKIMQLIKELSSQGTSIVLTTHLIGFAKSISDKIYFMDKGKILESGNTKILINPETERLKQFLTIVD
jgi:ABC-type polar amino acid transport system ATPase subunit